MRRVLVSLLLVAVAGAIAGVGGFSGVLRGTFAFDPTQTDLFTVDFPNSTSYIDLDYVVGPVTFGLTPVLGPVDIGLTPIPYWSEPFTGTLLLDSFGQFGPFRFAANAWLDVETATFCSLVAGWWIDVGGLELFGMWFYDGAEVYIINPYTGLWISSYGLGNYYVTGIGATLGAMGWLGESTLALEAGFNTYSQSRLWIYDPTGRWISYATRLRTEALGDAWLFPEEMGTWNPFRLESCADSAVFPFSIYAPQALQTCSGRVPFDWLNIIASHPFGCLDVSIDVHFTYANGFESVAFSTCIEEVAGLPWLEIHPTLAFATDSKSLSGYVAMRLGKWGCITPLVSNLFESSFFSFGSPPALDGFSLFGLHAEFQLGSVTIRAGTYTSDLHPSLFDSRGNLTATSSLLIMGFPTVPPAYRNCANPPAEYDEFIGILLEEDACCGGRSAGSLFVWFNDLGSDTSDWLFDIAEFDIDCSLGLTESLTIRGGLRITEANGYEDLLVGIDFAF